MLKPNFSVLQKLSVIGVNIILLGAFVGCAKYKSNSFTKPVGSIVEKNDVTACAQLLSEADSKYYFSRGLLKKGYQPVQIYVKNDSNQDLILDASTINMPIENRDHVAARAHIDATPRAIGWAVGGLFLWPFFIPAVVEAIQVPKVNKALDRDFESRTLDMNSKVAIKPHSTLNKVFFVRKESVSDRLEFCLKDSKTEVATDFGIKV